MVIIVSNSRFFIPNISTFKYVILNRLKFHRTFIHATTRTKIYCVLISIVNFHFCLKHSSRCDLNFDNFGPKIIDRESFRADADKRNYRYVIKQLFLYSLPEILVNSRFEILSVVTPRCIKGEHRI